MYIAILENSFLEKLYIAEDDASTLRNNVGIFLKLLSVDRLESFKCCS